MAAEEAKLETVGLHKEESQLLTVDKGSRLICKTFRKFWVSISEEKGQVLVVAIWCS